MAGRDELNFLRLLESPGSPQDYYLYRVDGREMLSTPFDFRLTLRTRSPVPEVASWIGAAITFAMGPSDGESRKINGKCVRFEHAYQKGVYTEFVIDVAPALVSLRLNKDNRIFADKSVKQVIGQVLQERQIAFDDSKVKGADEQRPYIVQYAESDFDFISRLMEREGIFYYTRYDEGGGKFKHKMYLADDEAGFFDGDPFKISFHREYLLQGLQEMETSYAPASGAWKTHDYDFAKPGSITPSKTATRLSYAEKPLAVYEWPGGSQSHASVQRRSKLAMEEAEAGAMTVEGVGSYIAFEPGARFQVDDTRLAAKERHIAVRSVVHAAWDPTGQEEGEASYHQQFTAVASQVPYRASSTTPPAVVRGPQTAVVIDQNDGEGHGRVKVRFHWDTAGTSTCWIRVAQQWGGGTLGAQWVPRVGWEVLIDFLDGDPDRPLVVGSLYNGDNKAPFALPANLSQSGWRTRSHPDGGVVNIFQFEDKAGAEEIYTFAGRNLRRQTVNDESVEILGLSTIRVGKDQAETVAGSETFTVGKDLTVTVGGDETHTVGGAFKLTAAGGVEITATSIRMSVGGSSVEITPLGVSVSGPLVKLN